MVPHLTTALSGPLLELEQRILDGMSDAEHWLRTRWYDHTTPFYASVDLRNSGFKLAPVDTNLFPGGFNNLTPEFMPLCVQAVMTAVEKICPDAQRFLLIPENHTRNLFYLQNIATLAYILRQSGMEIRIGSLLPEITEPTPIALPTGDTLLLEPVKRHGSRLRLADYDPCAILLNNDLSGGAPGLLQGLSQYVIPPLKAGWATRRKSRHFAAYEQVAKEFGALLDFDPWLINPYFTRCGEIDFRERHGEECLATNVDRMLQDIRKKYAEYGIRQKPYVIIKADAGTYGMGIMSVKDAAEVHGLNRKQRNKMAVIKEGQAVTDVILQEGVHTFENINGAVAEPVVYLIDHFVVGGFYRVHTGRGKDENLNSPGMHFMPLAFETACTMPDTAAAPEAVPNRFYAYGVVARLALLAAALELESMPGGA
ncbi:MAG TPA: glutamate--cysteine ligase [Betaproteobacteria bacterium]|nr:glutamate--cysteine ligase [Betaproteobacteria bacterium]